VKSFPTLHLRPGTLADYDALSGFHYRGGRPATATRVLVYEDRRPTPTDRFLSREPTGTVAAVLVESLPSLSCKMRGHALRGRYGAHLTPAGRARLLNAEVRCVSRVVVHPQWRGLGLAVELVRRALDTATTPVTEALAAMGRATPFFERAGMTAYPRPPHAFDARLTAALARAGFTADDLADPAGVWARAAALPPPAPAWLARELRRWYRQTAGRGGGSDTDPVTHLTHARDRLGLEPVYYAAVHG